MAGNHQLDRYLPERVRVQIEQQFYARVNAQARLEQIIHDPEFHRDPGNHVALFADHGVVHVRDVARQILQVLDTINGVLIPARDASRLAFMKAYGATVAYLHDIGMADFSPFGRTMHPEFAAQMVFDPELDGVIETIWHENRGNLAGRVFDLAQRGVLEQDPGVVLREMLAMANCHSKRKVPIGVLNDHSRLRQVMQACIGTDLQVLYRTYQVEQARPALLQAQPARPGAAELDGLAQAPGQAEAALADSVRPGEQSTRLRQALRRFYPDGPHDSFHWLPATHDEVRALTSDVVDTLRALRCADALRQRGTVLKTSGQYEIFVDQTTANAVYALRSGDEQLFLMSVPVPIAAGEANLASSELRQDGNLHVSFHRGAFEDQSITHRAAYCAAVAVNDIQLDVIESFEQPAAAGDGDVDRLKTAQEMLILLESVDDNLQFADLVREQLQCMEPVLGERTKVVPSLHQAPVVEIKRYIEAAACDWDIAGRRELLDKVARSGHNVEQIDPTRAFEHVKLVMLKADETLIEADSPSSFVYIPLGAGLRIMPLGGYEAFRVSAWMPLGITGVIRGAARNATVVADEELTLLMIPKEVYLREWHHPYDAAELVRRLAPTHRS